MTTISDAERRVLEFLASRAWDTPANIGGAMVTGSGGRAERRGSAQGLGRIGGGMCRKMIAKGLVSDASRQHGGFPAYAITQAGRDAMAAG